MKHCPVLNRSSLSLILLLVFSASAFGTDVYFIWEGTYALETRRTQNENGSFGYRIAAYLPPGTLIYDVKKSDYSGYLSAVTRHGVPLLIYNSAISENPFEPLSGKNVLVHKNLQVCSSSTCSSKKWIGRGSVLKLNETSNNVSAFKISHFAMNTRNEELFFEAGQYEDEVNKGFITEYDSTIDNGPRRQVLESKTIGSLSTECNDTRSEIDQTSLKAELGTSIEPTALIPLLSKWFKINAGVSASEAKTYTTSKVLGGPGISVEYRKIIIENNYESPPTKSTYYANIIYRCLQNSDIRVFVEQVQIKDDQGANRFVHGFDALHGTEISGNPLKRNHDIYQVYNKNGNRPFLTSINNHEYFEKIIDKFFEESDDASLVRIFLKEFNVGCKSKHREACGGIMKKLPES